MSFNTLLFLLAFLIVNNFPLLAMDDKEDGPGRSRALVLYRTRLSVEELAAIGRQRQETAMTQLARRSLALQFFEHRTLVLPHLRMMQHEYPQCYLLASAMLPRILMLEYETLVLPHLRMMQDGYQQCYFLASAMLPRILRLSIYQSIFDILLRRHPRIEGME